VPQLLNVTNRLVFKVKDRGGGLPFDFQGPSHAEPIPRPDPDFDFDYPRPSACLLVFLAFIGIEIGIAIDVLKR